MNPTITKRSTILAVTAGIVIIAFAFVFLVEKKGPASTSENRATTETEQVTGNEGPSDNQTAVNPPVPSATGLQVLYTDSGFTPITLTVRTGQTVTFVNQSSGMMWVASDPHPAHTIYPTFDEKSAVPRGSSYSFTFAKTGAWNYHNHYYPIAKGTIVVK